MSGNVYVVLTATVAFSGLNNYLIKLSNNGAILWNRVFTGFVSYQGGNSDVPKGPVISYDGNSIYFSTMTANGTGGDIATIKYNPNGDSLWVRRYNVAGNSEENARAMTIDDSANIYITGNTNSDITTLKYNTNGVQQWVAGYPGQSVDNAVDNLRNVYVCGMNTDSGNGFDYVTIKYSQPLGIKPVSNEIPDGFKLYKNYPNPFNSNSIIKFQISKQTYVKLIVYDILGREVEILVNEKLNPGAYEANWGTDNYPSGIYFCRINAVYKLNNTNQIFTNTIKLVFSK